MTITRWSPALRGVVLTVLACGVLGGCGRKRPPAVASAPPATRAAPPARPGGVPPQPVESGPDVQPVENEAAMGEDFAVSDPTTGEGGPLEDIHFAYDEANLTDRARAILEKHALWLQNHREARVSVEGHCDERGTAEYNLALGDARARAALDYLLNLGVAGGRLRAVSFGKERPLDPGHDESAWARNRRAHFTVTR